MVPQWVKRAQQASINLPLKSHAILFGSGHQIGSNKTRLHKAQQSHHIWRLFEHGMTATSLKLCLHSEVTSCFIFFYFLHCYSYSCFHWFTLRMEALFSIAKGNSCTGIKGWRFLSLFENASMIWLGLLTLFTFHTQSHLISILL